MEEDKKFVEGLVTQYALAPAIFEVLKPDFGVGASSQVVHVAEVMAAVVAVGGMVENTLKDLEAKGLRVDSPGAWFLVQRVVLKEWEVLIGEV